MSELVYTINQIFNKNEGALGDCKAQSYYIAPYQRGYKWASFSPYDQVPQMLTDIYEAYYHKASEYYLQYITIKKATIDENVVLEVIDGQQRLTTLAILFSRLSQYDSKIQNIAQNKLIYFRYKGDVFASLKVSSSANDEEINKQDEYYMIKAAKSIDTFICLLNRYNELSSFVTYLMNKVMLIFNLEDEFTQSEEIFENLNNNKVPLTNNYLIKGLLLTKAVHTKSSNNRELSYKEILDQRTIMGRLWDEIYAWINLPEVAHYFFATKRGEIADGMENLLNHVWKYYEDSTPSSSNAELELVQEYRKSLTQNGSSSHNVMYELFNKYNRIVCDEQMATNVLNTIKHYYRILYNVWAGDADFYNLFGYARFSESDHSLKWTYNLLIQTREQIKNELFTECINQIPDMQQEGMEDKLRYKSYNPYLTKLLLSFSVFSEQYKTQKFDFYRYDVEKWTFEHLSPQNPKGEIKIPRNLVDYVVKRLRNTTMLEEDKKIIEKSIFADEKISVEKLDFLYDFDIDEHVVGNMALLRGGDNSAVSNNPFVIKRSIIIDRINNGSFVPCHTISVYEKSLCIKNNKCTFTPDLLCWSNADIEAHRQWMVERNQEIRNIFTNQNL